MGLGEDQLVAEPDDMPTQRTQNVRPVRIPPELILVNRSIQLNDKPGLQTVEVGDVAVDRNLTAEFQAGELSPSAKPPKSPLGECLEAAKFANAVDAIHDCITAASAK